MVTRIVSIARGMVLKSEMFLIISAVPIGMPFRGMVEYMLSVNSAVEGLMVDAVTTAHAMYVAVVEDNRFQRLILVSLTPSVEYVAA